MFIVVLERPHGDLTFHLAQALIGHGCFRHYLCRIMWASDAGCLYFPPPQDMAEPTFFSCPHWPQHRLAIKFFLGGRVVQPSDVMDLVREPTDVLTHEKDSVLHCQIMETASRDRRVCVQMVDDILWRKEEDERVREAETRAAHVRAVHVPAPVADV